MTIRALIAFNRRAMSKQPDQVMKDVGSERPSRSQTTNEQANWILPTEKPMASCSRISELGTLTKEQKTIWMVKFTVDMAATQIPYKYLKPTLDPFLSLNKCLT